IAGVESGGSEYESLAIDPTAVSTAIVDDNDVGAAALSAAPSTSRVRGSTTYTVSLSGGPGTVAPTTDLVFKLANGELVTITAAQPIWLVSVRVNRDVHSFPTRRSSDLIAGVESGGSEYESLAIDPTAVSTAIVDD